MDNIIFTFILNNLDKLNFIETHTDFVTHKFKYKDFSISLFKYERKWAYDHGIIITKDCKSSEIKLSGSDYYYIIKNIKNRKNDVLNEFLEMVTKNESN
jgi:hypothetical protein